MDKKEELIRVYEEYIELLQQELDETVPAADATGWRSTRYEKGNELRQKIEKLKK